MTDHRTPPKPPFFDTAPEGTCRWCGNSIGLTPKGKPSKSRWHPECVREYRLLFWPSETRRAVKKRDKCVCAKCGSTVKKWHMDHRKPLIEAKGDITYWMMDNLQTLCEDCHKAKTSREAKERAEKRRENKKNIIGTVDKI